VGRAGRPACIAGVAWTDAIVHSSRVVHHDLEHRQAVLRKEGPGPKIVFGGGQDGERIPQALLAIQLVSADLSSIR
jgi:hypothetical protein